MPDLGPFHPQVVHFVIALGLVGIGFRLVSLVVRWSWLNPAAATLIVLAAGASVIAKQSGDDTHGKTERIPGARQAVQNHEEWGERARNALLILAGIELLGLVLAGKRAERPLRYLAAAGGLAAGFCIYEAAEHGGELVYEYAGGVGTRTGDPADVDRLLIAGLFNASRLERDSGRAESAARLVDELFRRMPADTTVRFLAIESKLRDRKDPAGALADLAQFPIPPDNRLASRHGLLEAEALVGTGQVDSARAVLTRLAQQFPANQAVKTALDKLR